MKPIAGPPRLKMNKEVSELLRAAFEERWSPERGARNERAIHKAIAVLPSGGLPGVGASMIRSTAKATVLKTAIALTAVASTAGSILWELRSKPALMHDGSAVQRMTDAPVAADDAGRADPAKPNEPDGPVADNAPPAASPTKSPPRRRQAHAQGGVQGAAIDRNAATVARQAESESTLSEQLALYQRARHFADQGDATQALSQLDVLERRFPNGVLTPEIGLARAELLMKSGRYGEARTHVDRLIEEPLLAGKRAALLLLSGDLWAALGDCGRAQTDYRRALGLGLNAEEADNARKGIEKCPHP